MKTFILLTILSMVVIASATHRSRPEVARGNDVSVSSVAGSQAVVVDSSTVREAEKKDVHSQRVKSAYHSPSRQCNRMKRLTDSSSGTAAVPEIFSKARDIVFRDEPGSDLWEKTVIHKKNGEESSNETSRMCAYVDVLM
uniref:Uncharacterized protein n=1 Tax=Trichogramma kaykai TaxID=54128 RepID=A0ABD2VRZ3_9HYME